MENQRFKNTGGPVKGNLAFVYPHYTAEEGCYHYKAGVDVKRDEETDLQAMRNYIQQNGPWSKEWNIEALRTTQQRIFVSKGDKGMGRLVNGIMEITWENGNTSSTKWPNSKFYSGAKVLLPWWNITADQDGIHETEWTLWFQEYFSKVTEPLTTEFFQQFVKDLIKKAQKLDKGEQGDVEQTVPPNILAQGKVATWRWIVNRDYPKGPDLRELTIDVWGDMFHNKQSRVLRRVKKNFNAKVLNGRGGQVDLREFNGTDPRIQNNVMGCNKFYDWLVMVIKSVTEKDYHHISVNCSKGRHRSVAAAILLKKLYFPNAEVNLLETGTRGWGEDQREKPKKENDDYYGMIKT